MKKILFSAFALITATSSFGQDAADKDVQAGLVAGAGLNFQKMGTKNMVSDGVGSDLTIGANVIFSFTETIGLCTGAEFDFNTVKYAPNTSSPTYYRYNDTQIIPKEESGSGASLFQLDSREQKGVYLTIPTMLLFRTNFIGYFRYFGKFGLRNSFLLSSNINDEGIKFDTQTPLGAVATNENMKAPGDMFFFKSAVGLCGGAEWNFTGSTCLVAELGYYYGITPLHLDRKEDKMTLYTSGLNNGLGNDDYFNNLATQSQLMFKLSILF
jgi:hypothetical protein